MGTVCADDNDTVMKEQQTVTPTWANEKEDPKELCEKNSCKMGVTMLTKQKAVNANAIITTTNTVNANAITSPLKMKKKKKVVYKNMMANIMSGTEKKCISEEKENHLKGLGGGNFSKIDKI